MENLEKKVAELVGVVTSCQEKIKKLEGDVRELKRKREGNIAPPTDIKQVVEYALKKDITHADPTYFFEYYEDRQWVKMNGERVKNWKNTLMTWERNAVKRAENLDDVDTEDAGGGW